MIDLNSIVHKVGDGLPNNRIVFLDGKQVDHVTYADPVNGVVKFHAMPIQIINDEIVELEAVGIVRVELKDAK